MFGYKRMITNFKINFKRTKFTYWKDRRPTYYEIHFWAWLYNLTNMITDWLSLPKGQIRARIDIRKDLIEMATREDRRINEAVLRKTGEITVNSGDNRTFKELWEEHKKNANV